MSDEKVQYHHQTPDIGRPSSLYLHLIFNTWAWLKLPCLMEVFVSFCGIAGWTSQRVLVRAGARFAFHWSEWRELGFEPTHRQRFFNQNIYVEWCWREIFFLALVCPLAGEALEALYPGSKSSASAANRKWFLLRCWLRRQSIGRWRRHTLEKKKKCLSWQKLRAPSRAEV